MEEAFLHYLWKHKKFDFLKAETVQGEKINILNVGMHNEHAGPDFFNSKIEIGNQLWAGNVEIHIKSSLWYSHGHETDPNYDNVILHVVWEHDAEVFRKDNSIIPVFEMKNYVSEAALVNYQKLFENKNSKWINCESSFASFETFEIENWLERLYFERLESKSAVIFDLLEKSGNNWEEVLFKILAKNFGLNVNADAFLGMANSLPFPVVRKTASNLISLEALFFGQAGMLEEEVEEPYFFKLKNEYGFLKQKFSLKDPAVTAVKFFRLRPDNFPTIRLAQLAALYASEEKLFSKIIAAKEIDVLCSMFQVQTSGFWETHYTFKKQSKAKTKKLSDSMIDLLLINTVIPLKFCFAKTQGKFAEEEILHLATSIKREENSVVKNFNSLRNDTAQNALQSQALLQLKKEYCDAGKCLKCNLGARLLR